MVGSNIPAMIRVQEECLGSKTMHATIVVALFVWSCFSMTGLLHPKSWEIGCVLESFSFVPRPWEFSYRQQLYLSLNKLFGNVSSFQIGECFKKMGCTSIVARVNHLSISGTPEKQHRKLSIVQPEEHASALVHDTIQGKFSAVTGSFTLS